MARDDASPLGSGFACRGAENNVTVETPDPETP
jgi:hypothetical protein